MGTEEVWLDSIITAHSQRLFRIAMVVSKVANIPTETAQQAFL